MYTNCYAVIEKDYNVKNEAFRFRYIGSPCFSAEEARELVYAHEDWGEQITLAHIDEEAGSYAYIEISHETGEILKEFFVKKI